MGGVVARALFTLPRFNTSLVKLIITQASPHLAPVLALDPHLLGQNSSDAQLIHSINKNIMRLCVCVDFYSAVRQKWVKEADKLRNITVLSIAGGYRDYQVRSGLTSLPCSSGDNNKLSLVVRVLHHYHWQLGQTGFFSWVNGLGGKKQGKWTSSRVFVAKATFLLSCLFTEAVYCVHVNKCLDSNWITELFCPATCSSVL